MPMVQPPIVQKFEYKESDCAFSNVVETDQVKSQFDKELKRQWSNAQEQGLFNYKLQVRSRIAEGKHGFLIQLNYQRRTNRRKPEPFQKLRTLFDSTKFNFTKIKPNEFLLQMHKTDGEKTTVDYNSNINNNTLNQNSYICINASPMSLNHCLIMPQLFACRPQWLEESDIRLSLEIISLSHDPCLCIAYSVTCAGASVNHLHLHCYTPPSPDPNFRLAIQKEIRQPEHLADGCYIATQLPVPPFVFELSTSSQLCNTCRKISLVVSYLLDNDIPHNMTVVKAQTQGHGKVVTRVLVWPRKPIIGAKSDNALAASVCELMGHILIPSDELYNSITEQDVVDFLDTYKLSGIVFKKIVNDVSILLNKISS